MHTILLLSGIVLDFVCIGLIIALVVNKCKKKEQGEN